MGLFDRFTKPKWQHKDPKVRLKGIKTLDDQYTLYKIAKYDSNSTVRSEAIKRINDKDYLEKLALYGNHDVNVLAISRINDESLLADIARSVTYGDEYVGYICIKKITDDALLSDIAKYALNNYVRKDAINKTNDVDALNYIIDNLDADRDPNAVTYYSAKERLKQLDYNNKKELNKHSNKTSYYDEGYFTGIAPDSNEVLDDWCICEDCGKKVNQIAMDIHKKCPHCGGKSFKPKE